VTADPSWPDLAGSLPTHQDEVMASHQGAPSIAQQSATHGAPAPAEDLGPEPGTVI
jgi:hypothetical protein